MKLIFFLLSFGIYSAVFPFMIICSSGSFYRIASSEEKKDIEKMWVRFIDAAEKKDQNLLKMLIDDSVLCYFCIENTRAEADEVASLRNDGRLFESDLYEKKIRIPADHFISEDVPLIFNRDMIYRLRNAKTHYIFRKISGEKYFEIIVTTTEPGEFHPGHEGGQHVFQFRQSESGYLLTDISTIP
ncbi:MAG: hypothetical protein OEZ34_02555 [Spirochaetia bacterium]|nr:hypothetical protein [Spirochaetia bacterium]